MRNEGEIRALRTEGEQYAAAGMIARAELVNDQLRLRGAPPVALPKPDAAPATRQKRTSTQAATRQKRGS